MSYQQEIVCVYFFIGTPCTVCSRAMLIMQLLDVLVVLECNVLVFLIVLLIIITYANYSYVFAIVSLSAGRYLTAHWMFELRVYYYYLY